MRQLSLLIGVVLAIASTGCPPCNDGSYQCDIPPDPSGTGGDSSSYSSATGTYPGTGGYGNAPLPPPSLPMACAAGASCLPGAPFCCNDDESLVCAGGVYAHMAWCNGESESCDSVGGGCSCPPGATRCIPEAPTQIQTCVPSGGNYEFQLSPCPPFKYCNTTTDSCESCIDECILGQVRCSSDKRFVERCQKLTGSGCNASVWVMDFSCADKNMYCSEPPFGPSSNLDYCVNECGGRGIVLQSSECSLDPNVPCSILYCNASTGTLEGDHIACLGAGYTCKTDSECASCSCSPTTHVCVGNTTKPCPTQNPCPL
ncbi:MAG TPA: hypothetical protein PK156_43455 [Polyangium sp.]|nr:hypothetical protein [Polyangium sp.]